MALDDEHDAILPCGTALETLVDRRRVRLSVRLVVTFGPAFATVASAVRDEIIGHGDAQTGVQVSGIDIAIEDLIADL